MKYFFANLIFSFLDLFVLSKSRINFALLYHSVEDGLSPVSVSKENFKFQMNYLRKKGFINTLNPADIGKRGGKFLITFDDGFSDVVKNALNMMDEMGYKGIVFVSAKYLGSNACFCSHRLDRERNIMNYSSLSRLVSHGWLVGNHLFEHVDMRQKTTEEVIDNINHNFELLKEYIPADNHLIAFPRGRISKEIIESVKENTNVKFGFGCSNAFLGFQEKLALSRVSVDNTFDSDKFKTHTKTSFHILKSYIRLWTYYCTLKL